MRKSNQMWDGRRNQYVFLFFQRKIYASAMIIYAQRVCGLVNMLDSLLVHMRDQRKGFLLEKMMAFQQDRLSVDLMGNLLVFLKSLFRNSRLDVLGRSSVAEFICVRASFVLKVCVSFFWRISSFWNKKFVFFKFARVFAL